MYPDLRATFIKVTLALSGTIPATVPAQAQSYQIDCAIMLCLAGGWPGSAPCARARAEFIRRITPWPVEPPLQIWRCPMVAAFDDRTPFDPMKRLYDIAFRDPPALGQSPSPAKPEIVPAQAQERADIDISGEAFDFVRSIHVYHIQFSQGENREGVCNRSDATRLGSYGNQGDYSWARSSAAVVPKASDLAIPSDCGSYSYRAVFVDWRDHAGTYGSEEVRY